MRKGRDDDDASTTSNEEDSEEQNSQTETDEDANEKTLQNLKQANIKALLDNSLETCNKPVLSKILTLKEGEQQLRRAFRSPQPGAPSCSQALKQRLLARKRFVPWGSNKPFVAPVVPIPTPPKSEANAPAPEEELPEGIEPLVLWEPAEGEEGSPIVVDNMATRFLRPHQREGVQFMFECVTGLRMKEGKGCILADDMGLGKTLQGITLLWTLLQSGAPALGGEPLAKRVIIVCPTSLVSNWDNECTKWLKGKVRTLPLCESSRDDVISSVTQFLHPFTPYQVLIISYETFRLHADRFKGASACDLLICDEAHRLKNDSTLTNRALDSLQCARRVLLSGTPMQNHLDEFYAMVDFCNPGVLGAPSEFRKHFEVPILAGREPGALEEEVQLGEERSAELSRIVNQFIMRRTNKLLSQHLPPKVVEVVCCRMTPLQQQLYCHFLESTAARKLLTGQKATGVLSAITSLKKLCNHPKLIYDAVNNKHEEQGIAEGFEDVGRLFPPGLFDAGRGGRPGMAVGWEETSGKMALLARMLHFLFTETDDRIVIVSNYTQTLDLVAQLCRERCYPFLRLDGSTSINKRQKLVKIFNEPAEKQFVFLLSSKAGGCGLNLIGANRLVLFDPDWNPANDKQAAARVWRDGQQKRVFVYRMLTTGTIEEKVFQRQMSKEGLQQVVSSKGGKAAANMMSAEELRNLFTISDGTLSDTYDSIVRNRDPEGGPAMGDASDLPDTAQGNIYRAQVGTPSEDDLQNWAFHSSTNTVPDAILQRSAGSDVTFVFTLQVDGKAIDETPSGKVHCGGGVGRAGATGSSSRLSTPAPQRHSAPAALSRGTPKTPLPHTNHLKSTATPTTTPSTHTHHKLQRPSGTKLSGGLSSLPPMNRHRHTMPVRPTPQQHSAQSTPISVPISVQRHSLQSTPKPSATQTLAQTPVQRLQLDVDSPMPTAHGGKDASYLGGNSSPIGKMQDAGNLGGNKSKGSPRNGVSPGNGVSPRNGVSPGNGVSPRNGVSPKGTSNVGKRGVSGLGVSGKECVNASMSGGGTLGNRQGFPSPGDKISNKSNDGQPGGESGNGLQSPQGKENEVSGGAGMGPRGNNGVGSGQMALSGAQSGASRLRMSSTGNDPVPSKRLRLTLGSKTLTEILDDDFV